MKVEKPTLSAIILFAAGVAAGPAPAADLKPMMNANGCNNCHAQSEQIVGPSFDAVRQKYQGKAGALELLEHKVRTGGSGVWGLVAMPPNAKISDADLRWLLSGILGGAKPAAKHQ